MKNHNLTTTLNIKIVGVVFLLTIMTAGYNHWLSLQEENAQNKRHLIAVADFLSQRVPPRVLAAIPLSPNLNARPDQREILELNKELQPALSNVCLPLDFIKFGFYSRNCGNIVAIGPRFDRSLLLDVDPAKFQIFIESTEARYLTENRSFLWYGAPAITYVRPVEEQGRIVGHIFASINQDMVAATIWKRTLNTLLGAFLMLMLCIIIFRELFVKLKKDLKAYAESILTGHFVSYRSAVPEFTPILNYISDQTKQMMRLDRLNIIGEMAAGIAHEIRNPMTTVRGLLQFIGAKQEFIQHRKNFNLMISELDCANDIISEFLSLSRDKPMELRSYSLNEIIEEVSPLLQADASYNNCNIILDLQDALPNILLDKNSIRQFVLNTVKNGIDAMPKGGDLTIRTTRRAHFVSLSIQDSGVGIPETIKEKIGTPFFTTKERGTGLGLAICYRIAQRHRAPLTIDSAPGKGTTITLRFSLPNHITQLGEAI